jgi:hypothetical protein
MRKTGLWVVALAFLSFFASSSAHAMGPNVNTANTIASMCNGTAGQKFNNDIANNNAAFQQGLMNQANNISTLFPIAQSASQCVKTMTDLLASLPSTSNPFKGLLQTIIDGIIANVLTSVCSVALDQITSAQSALTSFATICLPIPSFNGFDLPGYGFSSCSGGTQFNLISGFQQPTPTAVYNYSQYQSQ